MLLLRGNYVSSLKLSLIPRPKEKEEKEGVVTENDVSKV